MIQRNTKKNVFINKKFQKQVIKQEIECKKSWTIFNKIIII